MAEILLFGGTSEGRELAAFLKARNISALVCVATEYGESLLDAGGSVEVHTGRLNEDAMAGLIQEHGPRLVLDATHPYADAVSRNIRAACAKVTTAYLRVKRESAAEDGFMTFPTMDALIAWLNTTEGVIFSGLGAKEARALTAVTGFERRVWLRILPFAEGLNACIGAGFPAKHIICMQGPFSMELNAAMFRAAKASILITKESGAAGGFLEKLAAARACGMRVAVLKRPDEGAGVTLEEAKRKIEGGEL